MKQALRVLGLAACVSACTPHALPDACYQPPESGACRASMERYFFDPRSGECKAFVWGGCNGTVPFQSLNQCQDQCTPVTEEGHDEPAR